MMKQTPDMTRIPVISKNILSRNVKDKINILSLIDYDFYYEIDGIMVRIWTLIDGKTSLSKILDEIKVETPDRFHAQLETDFTNFIEELTQNKLITLS